MVEITRSDLIPLDVPAGITDVKHLSSYSWVKGPAPTIIVPGIPPRWSPLPGSRKLRQDSGLVYVGENAARHPDFPMEPLFRSLFIEDPSFDLLSVDVISDRNNIRKLLRFVGPEKSIYKMETFTIKVEISENTAIFSRESQVTSEVIEPNDFRGYGNEFERRYTTAELDGTAGHYRILSYCFCGMKFIIRHKTEGYDKTEDRRSQHEDEDSLTNLLGNLSLRTSTRPPHSGYSGSKLQVRDGGHTVPPSSVLEIKTRTARKVIDIDEVAPQIWISQTPKLVRAYHVNGVFSEPKVEDVSVMIKRWEASNQSDLMMLGWLIKKIISVTKQLGGKTVVKYDAFRDKLTIRKYADARNMLPDDIHARWKPRPPSSGST